jgi:hypothetical protein
MNSKSNVKGMLAGLFVGVLATLVLGSSFPTSHIGRYQIAGSGAFFVMIDTATGQAWSGDFHATINNPVPADFSGPAAQMRFFQPKLGDTN